MVAIFGFFILINLFGAKCATVSGTLLDVKKESINPTNSSFDYAPCTYSNGDVVCNEVPLEEVQKVLIRNTFSDRLASIKLILRPHIFTETFIPQDVFGTTQIMDIWIEFPFELDANRSLILQVDANAFRSTKTYTKIFRIDGVDCTLLDLGFLSEFEKLAELTFSSTYNIQHCLPSLPPLPKLTSINFEYCTGMNELINYPTLKNGLKDVRFFADVNNIEEAYNDETVDRIIDWLLLSSENTLEELTIRGMNQVTRVPYKIPSFKALKTIWLYHNNISTIQSGAFSFSVPVSMLHLDGNEIKEIEPGAFKGDFKNADVDLTDNNFSRFEESVFGPMLQQMSSGRGFINSAEGNEIDCSVESICHLAWLRRCSASSFSLMCSNGTLFQNLQAPGFNHCL